jgi:hypothetical protein
MPSTGHWPQLVTVLMLLKTTLLPGKKNQFDEDTMQLRQ